MGPPYSKSLSLNFCVIILSIPLLSVVNRQTGAGGYTGRARLTYIAGYVFMTSEDRGFPEEECGP